MQSKVPRWIPDPGGDTRYFLEMRLGLDVLFNAGGEQTDVSNIYAPDCLKLLERDVTPGPGFQHSKRSLCASAYISLL